MGPEHRHTVLQLRKGFYRSHMCTDVAFCHVCISAWTVCTFGDSQVKLFDALHTATDLHFGC